MIKNSWKQVFGQHNARYAGSEAGLPNSKPKWVLVDSGKGTTPGIMDSLINDQGYIYRSGAYKGCVDLETGKHKWIVQKETPNATRMFLSESFLLVEPVLFDIKTGEICYEYSSELNGHNFDKDSFVILTDNYVLKEWNQKSSPGLLYYLDIKTKEEHVVDSGLSFPVASDKPNEIFGWRGKNFERYDFVSQKTIWSLPIETKERTWSVTPVIENKVVLDEGLSIYIIDAVSGDIIWKKKLEELSSNLLETEDLAIALSPDVFIYHIRKPGSRNLEAFSLNDGKLLWKFQDKSVDDYCIAGDLVFAIEEEHRLVAYDKYSGEVVWEAEDTLHNAYGVQSYGNKVFFNRVVGEVRCYEWQEIYHSSEKLA
jgi:hypothetical protein